jgi:outer membrane PBP1 activator LpoA protein
LGVLYDGFHNLVIIFSYALSSIFCSSCQPPIKNGARSELTDGKLQEIPSQYGQDANTVLLDVMDTSIRNQEIDIKLNDLLDAIQDSNLAQAQKLLTELTLELPDNHLELVKAKLLIRKQELRHANN